MPALPIKPGTSLTTDIETIFLLVFAAIEELPDGVARKNAQFHLAKLHAKLLGLEKVKRLALELMREVDMTVVTRNQLAEAIEEGP